MNRVTIFIGSDSDAEIVEEACRVLEEFGISHVLEVTSAHRSPDRTLELIRKAEREGTSVFIAAAGKAAHLAGVVAAHTIRPVIGIPLESPGLGGLDSLLSTVQMPKGVPVATVALGKTGAANAAILAVEILALSDEDLRSRLVRYREQLAAAVEGSSRALAQKRKQGA